MLNLPEAGEVSRELSVLFGQTVKVKPSPVRPEAVRGAIFVYRAKDGNPRVAGCCDLALTNFAGAALALIPVKAAKEAIKQQAVSADTLLNCREVMNVLAGLLNAPGGEHVVLKEIYGPSDERPPALAALLGGPAQGVGYEIFLEGYGSGTLVMLQFS